MSQKPPITTVVITLILGCLSLLYQYLYLTRASEIDVYSLISEGIITLTLMFILLNLHRLHHKNLTFYYMNLGFAMLFLSLLTDASDEVFNHPAWLTTIFEDILQVLGFIIVFIGLRKWMRFNDQQNEDLLTLAITDELTGLYLRRFFHEKALEEFNRSRREQHNFSILMIDVDHFKAINDQYGHLSGDQVLQSFAREIKDCIRKTDVIARWGGEEFVVLLVNSNHEICAAIAEKIRLKTENLAMGIAGDEIKFTVSIGATVSSEEDESTDTVLDRADQLLYRAKAAGRNCVVQN